MATCKHEKTMDINVHDGNKVMNIRKAVVCTCFNIFHIPFPLLGESIGRVVCFNTLPATAVEHAPSYAMSMRLRLRLVHKAPRTTCSCHVRPGRGTWLRSEMHHDISS